uniref:Variant surface glycoprotein 1492 n=1 Tax=Trypanosoma brucei TaxID=5691 RepID=M4TBR6_9TRYP
MQHSNAANDVGGRLLALVLIFQTATADEITGTETAKGACDDLTISIQLAKSFKAKVSSARLAAAKLQNRAFLWQIAAASEKDNYKRRAKQALQLLLQGRYKTQLATITANEQQLEKAAQILDARAASIYTAALLQPTGGSSKEAPTATNLGSHGGTAATCTVTQKLTKAAPQCDETKINNQLATVGTLSNEADKQVKLLGDKFLQQVSLKTKTVAVGTASTHTNIGTVHEGDCANGPQGRRSTSHLLGVDIEPEETAAPTLASKDIKQTVSGTKQCQPYDPNNKWYATNEQQTLSAICAGLTTTVQEQQTDEEETGETLAKDPEMIKLSAQMLMDEKAISKMASTERPAKIANIIKQSYGAEHNDFKNNYINELEKAAVKFKNRRN